MDSTWEHIGSGLLGLAFLAPTLLAYFGTWRVEVAAFAFLLIALAGYGLFPYITPFVRVCPGEGEPTGVSRPRDRGEDSRVDPLSGLRRVRNLCLGCMAVAIVVFAAASAITVVPRARAGMDWFLASVFLVALSCGVVGIRAGVIQRQVRRGLPRTVGRLVPVWLAVVLLLAGAVVILWRDAP